MFFFNFYSLPYQVRDPREHVRPRPRLRPGGGPRGGPRREGHDGGQLQHRRELGRGHQHILQVNIHIII